jgi:peptidoglycan-N-acetylglucosamine deacetylase
MALVRRMANEGHHFINHSQSHPSFTGFSTSSKPLTSAQRQAQLTAADDVISALTGTTTKPWFRPPYGDIDNGVAQDVAVAGYPMIAMWTVDSLGWKSTPANQVVQRCLSRVEPGAVYLFHVGSASTDADAFGRHHPRPPVGGVRDCVRRRHHELTRDRHFGGCEGRTVNGRLRTG